MTSTRCICWTNIQFEFLARQSSPPRPPFDLCMIVQSDGALLSACIWGAGGFASPGSVQQHKYNTFTTRNCSSRPIPHLAPHREGIGRIRISDQILQHCGAVPKRLSRYLLLTFCLPVSDACCVSLTLLSDDHGLESPTRESVDRGISVSHRRPSLLKITNRRVVGALGELTLRVRCALIDNRSYEWTADAMADSTNK